MQTRYIGGMSNSSTFAIIFSAAIAENVVLSKMLGLCPFISLSKRLSMAAGVGAATTMVLTSACALAWIFESTVPADLAVLRPLVFIAAVAIVVQLAQIIIQLYVPLLHRHLGIFLPLIATNCAVLGVMLTALGNATSWRKAIAFGFGGGVGFAIAVVCFALIRERLIDARVPATLRGAPLCMITAGIMSLAFSGLYGAIR